MQAVSELLEQHTRQFAASVKDILDPKKLSAGAGAPASSSEGPRAAHGSATNKWQVCGLTMTCSLFAAICWVLSAHHAC